MADRRQSGGGHSAGYKRRREYEEPLDSTKLLLSHLIAAGDPDKDGTVHLQEDMVRTLVKQLAREARANPDLVHGMLLDCAVQLSTKAPVYALLAGLLNVDEPELVQGLVQRAAADINGCLQPEGDMRRARLLLRFCAALVITNVVHPASLLAAVHGVVNTAINVADSSTANDDGRSWQPYTDYLVYVALMALPWGGQELADSMPSEVQRVLEAVNSYMEKRPRKSQPSLRPFAAAIKEDDPLAESDNGGASFLNEVVAGIKEMVELHQWQLDSVPRVHMAYEVALAEGQGSDLPGVHASLQTPVQIPDGASQALVGALVLEAFPPRGTIQFLEKQHIQGERILVERLIAEEYMLDTCFYFESDRVECAKRLAAGLPLPYAYEPLLCQVLFSQLLRLPRPQFKTVMYATLMVDLCKLRRLFPRAMSACVRESFARMNVMDPQLRLRLAEWLAYHLSNFEYVWPWSKWQHVLAAPVYDGQRCFCVAVMNRLMRLSYWERIQSLLPVDFRQLLPSKPDVIPLPAPDHMEDVSTDPEAHWAAKMLQLVRSKATPEDLDAWQIAQGLEDKLGGMLGVLRCMARCLLVAGAKSYTHMVIALERYYGPLKNTVDAAGIEGEYALVEVANSVWQRSPQRAAMAVDRLMTLRLVSAEAIIGWVFNSTGVTTLGDESLSGAAWEILYNAINKTTARVQDAQEDLAATEAVVAQLQAQVDALMNTEEMPGAAAVQLEEVVQVLEEKRAYVSETRQQQQSAFLQVLMCFIKVLAPGHSAKPGTAMETDPDEVSALHEFMLAALKAFVRRFNVQCAQIADQITNEVLAGDAVPESLKEAVLQQLYL